MLINFSGLQPALLLLLTEWYMLDGVRYTTGFFNFILVQSLTLPELVSRFLFRVYSNITVILLRLLLSLIFMITVISYLPFLVPFLVFLLLLFCILHILFDLIFNEHR